MYFDWITGGIWLMGFIIMVIWIWIPLKEFRKLLLLKRSEHRDKMEKSGGEV
jgi:hypothetical protein